ncbi:glycosyltransferase [Pseudomonas sp.]|uniref:glycosyltransferase family protein n=1 Tax=Pseudomonas sp. TaxID=306 RepID=UPI001A0CB72D|nr:glycosyltransferase [Pseudomonas sp.]MBF0676474.1 glycosyltransferase family 1 protein [Pseudomonas sp.]
MKVLALTSSGRSPDFTSLYAHLADHVDLDVRVLDKSAQRNLRASLKGVQWSLYERVLIDLNFKHVYRQAGFLRGLKGLMVYEEDACQNYIPCSRWRGKFSKFYRALPNAKFVVTGASVARRLKEEGFSAVFIPKGYDPKILFDECRERDIELGFIGRTASSAYTERKALLDNMAACESLQLLRTDPGDAYRGTLNRIRYFVSADVGLDEYMAKNFEAMACGCVLLAWRQGEEENAIGLQDGKHLLLYSSVEQLRHHLKWLRCNPEQATRLATAGKEFVKGRLTFAHLAEQLAAELRRPWPVVSEPFTLGSWVHAILWGARRN